MADSVFRLLDHVDEFRRRRGRECERLLRELTPHLQAARLVERQLDRHLASRFNTFGYLRDDELGLSRVIADLLDPAGDHGQGATFLEAMLELLEVAPEASDSNRFRPAGSGRGSRAATLERLEGRFRFTAAEKIRVVLERGIPSGRRIDITVEFPTAAGLFCLAFENKPYAGDQGRQCTDYLKFLEGEYDGRFLLVYLPPRYRLPDESSLRRADRKHWKNHFRVLPYVARHASLGDGDPGYPSDGDGTALAPTVSGADDARAEDGATDHNGMAPDDELAVRDGASLADWFETCCKLSEAERLRWFLREAQLFCQQHFGDSTMTDTEARYIRKYLSEDENRKHLHAAFAVARAWPALKHDVCRRFLEHLRDRIQERIQKFPEVAGDLVVGCHYGGDGRWSSYLCLYRCGWVCTEHVSDRSNGRTAVMLECGKEGPTVWRWGVRSPKNRDDMTDPEKERRQKVEEALTKTLTQRGLSLKDSPHWPHSETPRYENWTVIVPELAEESAKGGGEITDYYVNGLLEIAKKAIPAIDDVELVGSPALGRPR